MCGIIGYTGKQEVTPILIQGLERMEYRGYDSSGIAVIEGGQLTVRKAVGRIAALKELLAVKPVDSHCGIGHTRWATHGAPSDRNAHPHTDMKGKIAVIHNGIIENYFTLKNDLMEQGVEFATQTDTEVVAQLLGFYYTGDMFSTLQKVMPMLEGAWALGIISSYDPDAIYCARKESPLIIGKGTPGDGNFIASDASAILQYTRDVLYLENYDVAKITPTSIEVWDKNFALATRKEEHITWDIAAAEKGGFDHFMVKEIFEQPKAIADAFNHYVDVKSMRIRPETMPFTKEEALALPALSVVACGTAYHAGVVGKALIEKLARLPVTAYIGSEFRYGDALVRQGEAFIAVSQSGETADTLAAVKKAKEMGSRVVSICNVIGSSVARESSTVLYTLAGPEIAVASTKAYITQVLIFTILAIDLAFKRETISEKEMKELLAELAGIPNKAELVLNQKERVEELVEKYKDVKSVFFIGRLLDYALSMEAALKLKEVSYLHSEAYAAGELKHGTIALIEPGTLVVATATQGGVFDKTMSNVQEVRVRGASIMSILGHSHKTEEDTGDTLVLPETLDIFTPLLAVIPIQMFAYYMAKAHGRDIDKPRNLAKSVTVE